MRRASCAILVCATALAAGCFLRPERAPAPGIRALAPPPPAEGLVVKYVLLERPAGDPFLDRDLWKTTLPVGSPEARALLAENGLRAGVLTGSVPARFVELIESETEAITGRELTFAQRRDEVLPTSGAREKVTYSALTDLGGKRHSTTLNQARAGILVRPEAMPDNCVRLWCEPRLQHGEKQVWLRPSADATGFVKHEEVPLVRYPTLAFDVALGRGEYLVIGWDAEQDKTLGEVLFAVEANGQPRQRVLVIRAAQLNPGNPPDLRPLGLTGPPSIAATAGRPR